ncbi:MAG: hypothetical protein J5977_10910 [Fibrobacter sp.]|nr:hypothetical protein [Fibrobacter sp.]
MSYVYVKDSEGFVFKKKESDVSADEKIISEKEYLKKSGIALYEKKFRHGGARENAGRKTKFASPLKFQIRVTKEEKDFLTFARSNKLNFATLMNLVAKID